MNIKIMIKQNQIPKKLHLFINKYCNFNCKYCYWENHPKEEMSIEIANHIIDYIRNNPEKYDYITFFGGEPMLSYKLIAKFINEINLDIKYIIMTNGSIHPKKLLDNIKNNKANICFTFSYDGLYQSDRSNNTDKQVLHHIKYLKDTKRAYYCIATMLTPYHYELIPKNIIEILTYTDAALFHRICNLSNEWKSKDLKQHLKDFPKIVDIVTYYTIVKEKQIWLSNRIDKPAVNNGDNVYGSKGNTCQKSLAYTDICGTDGKKYLCEVAFALNEECYGYLWEDNPSIAIDYDKQHHNNPYHYCLFYKTECKTYDVVMEQMREKFQIRKQKLQRLKNAKMKYLLSLDNKGRLLNLANNYFRN